MGKHDERLEQLHESLTAQVAALTSSEAWLAWLDTAAQFHQYSFNNTMLIMIQRPDATLVAGYGKWQEMGRQVRKGERSIGIFAPCTRKVTDVATGEDKRIVTGFRVVSVFDVAQTDGDPLPEPVRPVLLDGEAPHGLWDALAGIVADRGYTLERGNCGGANGYTRPDNKTIRVREDVTDAQAVKTLAHETAHMLLHTSDTEIQIAHRGEAEVEAESVAYLVAKIHGLETSTYTLPYLASWSGKDGETLIRKTAERVLKTARLLINVTVAETGVDAAA